MFNLHKMKFQEIYTDIVNSFGALWNFKEREDTLEIITPFATTSQKFVSIFLTQRDQDYIISDGGWIYEGLYSNSFDRTIDCYNKLYFTIKIALMYKRLKIVLGYYIFIKN